TSALSACAQHAVEPAATTRRERARRHIEKNLGSAKLGPDDISRAIGVSRSSLYVIFQPLGGVAKYIQARRLAHLRAALARPLETRSVAQLCYESGFASESHASRAFKQAYGVPPGQFRTSVYSAQKPATRGKGSTRPVFHGWIADLHGTDIT
nr:helix-turn-helix transcriptional regulator [Pseudomonas sp.]